MPRCGRGGRRGRRPRVFLVALPAAGEQQDAREENEVTAAHPGRYVSEDASRLDRVPRQLAGARGGERGAARQSARRPARPPRLRLDAARLRRRRRPLSHGLRDPGHDRRARDVVEPRVDAADAIRSSWTSSRPSASSSSSTRGRRSAAVSSWTRPRRGTTTRTSARTSSRSSTPTSARSRPAGTAGSPGSRAAATAR